MSFAHQEIFFLTFLNHQQNHNPRITFVFTFFFVFIQQNKRTFPDAHERQDKYLYEEKYFS